MGFISTTIKKKYIYLEEEQFDMLWYASSMLFLTNAKEQKHKNVIYAFKKIYIVMLRPPPYKWKSI